jgi:putative transposase
MLINIVATTNHVNYIMAKLSKEDYEYRRTEGSVSSLNYHFVFVPKRRKAVLIKEVAARLQEIILELVIEHGWKLIAPRNYA